MPCSRSLLLVSALLGLSSVGHGIVMQTGWNGRFHNDDGTMPDWIQNVSHLLEIDGSVRVDNETAIENTTAIVTFAGKRSVEYIDGAIMLGLSIKKHAPDTPMVALVIEAMTKKMKALLRGAGWKLVQVPNWDREYCGANCDLEFLGRWHDSFEKINAFRLPFKKVLFLDSDTYIFSSQIQELLHRTEVPEGHIAMAKDGCKDEYNSGVMVYKPDLNVFMMMLKLVNQGQREQILDQTLVNEVFRDRIVEVPREFNCVDTLGIQPGQREACKHHCSDDVVVAHFTGHPKPTAARRKQLELVRRPGSPAIACTNTNFGSCRKWSSYYCDIREHHKKLSKNIRYWLKSTGGCCHSPFDPNLDDESCKECPATLEVKGDLKELGGIIEGAYVKTTIKPAAFNGGRPIYMNMHAKGGPYYLYFNQKQMLWMFGQDTQSAISLGYAGVEAQCPRDAKAWTFWDATAGQKKNGASSPPGAWVRRKLTVTALPNEVGGRLGAPNDTELIAWNLDAHAWEREAIPEGLFGGSDTGEKEPGPGDSDTEEI